ncbi:MAG: GNAT family N-acetyltransferase [Lachnospiraceae bacterium]
MRQGDSEINILLTSAGRRSYLVDYFKEILGDKGKVYVTNSTPISTAFERADESVISPLITTPDYIPFLLDYVKKQKIQAIIPLFDIDLPILAKAKEEFEKVGTRVIVSDPDVVDICNDKWKTYLFLKENGFQAPRTYLGMEEVQEEIAAGKLTYPIIIKPRWGMGSIAIYEADNEEELKVFSKKIKRNIEDTYLRYLSKLDDMGTVLYQEKLDGQEYGLDVINDLSGNYQNTIVKMKLGMRSGETDCALTVKNSEMSALGQKLSEKLQHIGNLDVDVFSVGEKMYVLELNARFGGGYPFSHLAGVNLPKAIVSWLRNEIPNRELVEAKIGVMGQKEILPVKLSKYQALPVSIEETEDEEIVRKVIENLEKNLYVTLTQRNVSIAEYVKKLCSKGKNLLLKDSQGRTIGIACGYMNDKTNNCAYLSLIIIDKQYQNLHLGTALFEKFEIMAVSQGMRVINLEVNKKNENAIKFYLAHGFKVYEEKDENSFYMMKRIVPV